MKRENNICSTLRVGVKLDYFCAIQLKPTQWHFRKVVCKGPPSLPLPFLLPFFSFSFSCSLLLSLSSSSFSAQGGGGDGVQWRVPPHAASASGQQNPCCHQARWHSVWHGSTGKQILPPRAQVTVQVKDSTSAELISQIPHCVGHKVVHRGGATFF